MIAFFLCVCVCVCVFQLTHVTALKSKDLKGMYQYENIVFISQLA